MTNSWHGLPPTPEEQIGGHEGVGHIVRLGSGAETSGLGIGDRVGVKWVASACGNCGYYTPGTFQQYLLRPAAYVTRIPDEVESVQAAPLLCAGLTVYSALKRSTAIPGQWVVISGAGAGLGHLAVQIASKGLGLRVIGIDHGQKADFVKKLGAEHFVDITKFPLDDNGEAISNFVKSLTEDLGAHSVIVCTAANIAYSQGLRFLRYGGSLVCVGLPAGAQKPIATASPSFMVSKQLRILGSAVGNRVDATEVLNFAARGIVKVHVREEQMDGLSAIFQDMREGKLIGRAVINLS